MKTQIIELDIHDDVTSVRDKMSWTKAERILLVFPPRSRILPRPLDLLLLQRHAASLGADLAIVSQDNDKRRSAEELAIPAFARVESAKRKSWVREKASQKPVRREEHPDLHQLRTETFHREPAWHSYFWFRFGFFTLAVLSILVVLSLFIPSATILLKPASGLQSLTLTIHASREVTSVSLAGTLPALLSSLTVEQSKTAQATGTVGVPDARASGLATFRNLTSTQVSIPTGTVIRTQSNPSVRFATTTDVVVAAGIDKTLDVPIQAVEAGTTGNLPADALVSFEGELGTRLAVTNSSPTKGGSDKSAPIQTTADRSNLREVLMSEILGQCGTNFHQTFTQGDVYFPDTLVVSQILSETFFPAADQSGDTLSLTLRVQCQAQYATRKDLDTLAKMALDASLPGGYSPSSTELTESPTSSPITDAGGVTSWAMQVQRRLQARLNPLMVIQSSAGRKPVDAIGQLKKSLALDEAPVIHINPYWWPWMPLIPLRITVSTGN
jgi:hypothetical protein